MDGKVESCILMKKNIKPFIQVFSRRSGLYLASILVLFLMIGILTTVQPAYRFSSTILSDWTRNIDELVFYNMLGMENRAYKSSFPDNEELPKLSNIFFQLATNIQPSDPRSLLGNELPGFSIYDSQILMANGDDSHFTSFPIESNPPLEEVLKDREAVVEDDVDEELPPEEDVEQTTGDRDVVFLYTTHNRESFLPHLPGVEDPNSAMHAEINISKVSERLGQSLERKGIGTFVDKTDFGQELNEQGKKYHQSYEVSREAVETAFSGNKDIQYVFDLHRDALRRDKTTIEIDGESYAKLIFVVGTAHANYEENMKTATELNALIEEKYPGLSRGIYPKDGSNGNGVYNQDVSGNALLIEFGGVDNTMEELYRSADALAEVFSEYYWDAEEVSNP